MANSFGITLDDRDLRWAAAEGVPKSVIAAIYLLEEKSVGQIVARLTTGELEQVIRIVGRSPRGYAPGAYDALKEQQHRRSMQRSAAGTSPAEGPNSPATPIHPRNGTTRPTDAHRHTRPSVAPRSTHQQRLSTASATSTARPVKPPKASPIRYKWRFRNGRTLCADPAPPIVAILSQLQKTPDR